MTGPVSIMQYMSLCYDSQQNCHLFIYIPIYIPRTRLAHVYFSFARRCREESCDASIRSVNHTASTAPRLRHHERVVQGAESHPTYRL